MKGASIMVKMSLVVVGVTLAAIHMKIDGLCNSQSRTETNTGGGNGGLIGKMFSGNSLKSTSIAAIATLALAFLASNSQASAAVSKAAHLNNDVVNEAAIKLETDNYLEQQFRFRRDIEQLNGDININENIIGDYDVHDFEEDEEWLKDSDDNDDDSDYEYDDDEEYERFKRGTKLGNFEKKQMRCKKYEKQIVKRFAEEILESIESRNSTMILQDGQSKKLGKKLKLIKRKCDQEPITYVGPVKGGVEKTGKHEYTLLEMEKLGKMAEKYRKATTLAPSTYMNGNDNILENNSTSILNGTNTNNISPIINKATISVTNNPNEITENPECKIKEKELLDRFSDNIIPEATYNKSLFEFNQEQHEILARNLREMQQMNCYRTPLKYKNPVYASDDVKFHHQYTLGDNISLNSIKKQLGLEISPTTVMPTENPGCEEKKIEMTRIVGSELREALENDEDTFEVRSSFMKKRMETISEEMEEMNCISPLQFEPMEGSKKKFSMTITDNAYVQEWENERRAKKKAERENENSSDLVSTNASKEIDESTSPNNDVIDLDVPEHPKCDNRRDRLLKAVEFEVEKALLDNNNIVKVAASKEKPIRRILDLLEEGHCRTPLEMKEKKSGDDKARMKFKILDIDYLREFSGIDSSSENSNVTISSNTTELTPPVSSNPTTLPYKSSTDNGLTLEPCQTIALPMVREFEEEIRDAIDAGTNKFIVSLEKHNQYNPNLNEYARNNCQEQLIKFDDAHGSGEADKFAYYKFTDEPVIRFILQMPPMTTAAPPSPHCTKMALRMVHMAYPQVLTAINNDETYIDVPLREGRWFHYIMHDPRGGCTNSPFRRTGYYEEGERLFTRYEFSPTIQQDFPRLFSRPVNRAPDIVLELPSSSSSTTDFNQTGTENSAPPASTDILLSKVLYDEDFYPQSTTTQSISQESITSTSESSLIKPICENILTEIVHELDGAFEKMFAKGNNKLILGVKQSNKLLQKENALIDNGCNTPFQLVDASFKGNGMRVTFDVDNSQFFENAKNEMQNKL